MANFVLVHGAMHGGWCWKNVRSILAKAGHLVLTPTLTGQGERRRELSRRVGVETHVEDVLETLWFEDIDQVHLVLHSYAGILAGPIAERTVGLLSSITFLGAFLVQPGECLLDVEPPAAMARYRRLAMEKGDGWRLPATTEFLEQWGISDPDLREAVGKRLTDFPLACQTQRRFNERPSNQGKTQQVCQSPGVTCMIIECRNCQISLPTLQRSNHA